MSRIPGASPGRARVLGWVIALALAVLAFAPGAARAGIIINTDGTNTAGGGANTTTAQGATVNAQVDISFNGGTMTLTLNNLFSSATAVGQSITGIEIFTSPTITVSAPLQSTSGQLLDPNAVPQAFVETGATGLGTGPNQGQFVGGSSTPGLGISSFDGGSGTGHNAVAASNWDVTQQSPGIITVLNAGQPTQSVVSAAGAGSGFTNTTHIPVFSGSVTLVAGTTWTDGDTITGVKFLFGTGTDSLTINQQPPPVAAPAPSSMVLALSGLVSLGLLNVRRLRRTLVVAA